uniref:50S ribosomal protein L5 n=1 Tax=Strongyloides venezuelensis TaxID=75913 RepID=A0A0K0G683_STRVS
MDNVICKTVGALKLINFPHLDKIKELLFEIKKKNDNFLKVYFTTKNFATQEIITKLFCEFKKAFTEDGVKRLHGNIFKPMKRKNKQISLVQFGITGRAGGKGV